MDEKGARLACPGGQEVVPVGIDQIYVGIPENRLSLTIIIGADGTVIPPVVIVPGTRIMEHWFHTSMTGHELITVSESGYTKAAINMVWLEHFIKYNIPKLGLILYGKYLFLTVLQAIRMKPLSQWQRIIKFGQFFFRLIRHT